MISKIYSVYDVAVNAYLPPFFMRADGEAIRAFTSLVRDPKSRFNADPQDYILFYLGDFDDNGALFGISTPVSLAKGHEVLHDPDIAKAA